MTLADCTGVVLAGGTGRRFADGNKALATVEGVPMVRRVVDRLASATGDPVVVSVRTAEQEREVAAALADSSTETTLVRDADAFDGPLAGVSAAVDRVETARFALVACDMPLFEPGVFEWLDWRDWTDAVVPVAERPQPLQALYRSRAVADVLDDLPSAGGLHALLDELAVTEVDVSGAPSGVPARRSLTNVNTVEQLEAAERRIARESDPGSGDGPGRDSGPGSGSDGESRQD